MDLTQCSIFCDTVCKTVGNWLQATGYWFILPDT